MNGAVFISGWGLELLIRIEKIAFMEKLFSKKTLKDLQRVSVHISLYHLQVRYSYKCITFWLAFFA